MSLEIFFDTISNFVPGVPRGTDAAISRLNPDKIYLENVRSALGVSSQRALDICEAAVRQGLFQRGVEVACPDGAIAASADTESGLPAHVRCWMEDEGHLEEVEIQTDTLPKIAFYRLK